MQVTADYVGSLPTAAVPDDRDTAPRRWLDKSQDRHGLGRARAANRVSVAVGHYDHVPLVSPVTLVFGAGYPTRPARHDVEQDQSVCPRVQPAGHVADLRFDGEALGELRTKEDRT